MRWQAAMVDCTVQVEAVEAALLVLRRALAATAHRALLS